MNFDIRIFTTVMLLFLFTGFTFAQPKTDSTKIIFLRFTDKKMGSELPMGKCSFKKRMG